VVLITGGVLFPLAVAYLEPFLENCSAWVATPDDYYQLHSSQGSTVKNVTAGEYKVIIFDTNYTNETDYNTVNVSISHWYRTTEIQTQYKNETRYRTVTKTRNETRYRVEERIRLENRTVEKSLLSLPKIKSLSWNTIAACSILSGAILIRTARQSKPRKRFELSGQRKDKDDSTIKAYTSLES